jgi:hypothetical protein
VILGDLDALQGTDPDLVAARKHMPEPSRWPEQEYVVMIQQPEKILKWLEEVAPTLNQDRRVVFSKRKLRSKSISFWAWKGPDGKVYL